MYVTFLTASRDFLNFLLYSYSTASIDWSYGKPSQNVKVLIQSTRQCKSFLETIVTLTARYVSLLHQETAAVGSLFSEQVCAKTKG